MTMNKEIEAPLPPRPAWNADFPIDRVEAQHVLRREFAKYLGLCLWRARCGQRMGRRE